jgi:sigma-B regulation protein RsbU (phosphoserine phosphatase)
MDSILIYGLAETKMEGALRKMGYEVHLGTEGLDIFEFTKQKIVDLIFLSATGNDNTSKLVIGLKENPATRRIPIVYLTDNQTYITVLKEFNFERLEMIERGATLGSIISKTATMLRLRKMIATDKGGKQDVFDLNAHLRDLTEKHKKEIEEARQIQENLLPKTLPKGDSFELAVCYIPLEELGGDYYDFVENNDGTISIAVADATGHGLPAAFISSMIKMARVAVDKIKPDGMLTAMNQLMTPQMPPGRFVTMAVANFNPNSGKVVFSRAGHPPALLINRRENKTEQIKAGGFALGFMSDVEYGSEERVIESGDVLVLMSDGICEAQNRNLEMFGHNMLADAILKCPVQFTAEQILKSVVECFKQFIQGRILKDDVTMIILKRK